MISTIDELIAALGAAQSMPFRKAARAGVPFGVSSMWGAAGVPGPGEQPTTLGGTFPTRMTPGALRFSDPVGADVSQLARAAATCSEAGQLVIYDRIWHSRFNANSTALQAITWPALGQRHADGVAVELYAEIATALGSATPATWTAQITDQDGVPGQLCTAAYDGQGMAGRMIPFSLPEDALGVQRVHSIQLSAAQASGAINLVLVRRIAEVAVSVAGGSIVATGVDLGLPPVPPGACLALMVAHGAAASSGALFGRLELVQS